MKKKAFTRKSVFLMMIFIIAVLTLFTGPIQAATYDHFDNGFQVGPGNKWLGFVDDPFALGSFNKDGILSVSGSFLASSYVYSPSNQPTNSVYGYTGRLTSPVFSDNFSATMQFSNFNVSSDYYTNGQYKLPNLGFGLSYAPGYGIRVARFQLINYGGTPGPSDWFVVVRSEGLTPGGPGPSNNVFWQPLLRAYSDSGMMGFVRNGSMIETWASDGPGGAWTKLYTFNIADYANPLNLGVGVQAFSGGGSFNVQAGWVDRSPVPIPAAIWLMGAGLVGLVGVRRRFSI